MRVLIDLMQISGPCGIDVGADDGQCMYAL